jgi:2'-5' RNA ligase
MSGHPGARSATRRTFAAVFPPEETLTALRDLQEHLLPASFGLRWTSAENLHFTLRFFGDLRRGP